MPSSSPSRSSDLERGRSACRHREWNVAYEALARADAAAPLEAEDLEILALSAFLVGREDEYAATLERAHQRHLEAGTLPAAARAAVWLGLHLAERGEMARASGWFGRAGRLVERIEGDCVEAGYLLLPAGIRGLAGGAYDEAYRLGGEAAERADRFGDRDLHALAVHLQGRARLRQGKVDEGLALLDEAMVGVAADELSPLVTGLIYCSVISACRDVYAVGRAHEWTEALSEWCERQPGMVAYTGECRVYRAELMQLHGAWHDAIEEARRATDRLGDGGGSAIGLAHYQEGEAYRLLGDLDAAEAAYRAASRAGREPQPGLALLRLARGDSDAAAAMLRRALAETEASLRRARLLPAYVEVLLEAGEPDDARRACEELVAIAARVGSAALDATAAHSRGAVALAEGDPESALVPLRRAAELWRELDAPYDAARARLLLGHACRALGDEESAALEIDAANAEFRRLGAGPDAARAVGAPSTPSGPHRTRPGHGLTPREREVLAELATGKTNRAIAESLFISEKTVARHVSNIFAKLDVSTRTAATAFAYEHEMLDPPA